MMQKLFHFLRKEHCLFKWGIPLPDSAFKFVNMQPSGKGLLNTTKLSSKMY